MNQYSRILIFLVVAFTSCMASHGATDYTTLESKAARFYANSEWTSATAMYELMLEQKPMEIPIYARAIVAGGILKNPELQFQFMERTQKFGLSLDSIFNNVKNEAFALSQPQIYEDFLMLMKSRQSWLARNINIQLLSYYTFRNDVDNMISTAEMLLKSTPDNVNFLQAMGDAYCMKGELAESMTWYKKIIEIQPNNYNALLTLGNYYNILVTNKLKEWSISLATITNPTIIQVSSLTTDDKTYVKDNAIEAIKYLSKAYEIKSTPYIAHLLDNIRPVIYHPTKKKRK